MNIVFTAVPDFPYVVAVKVDGAECEISYNPQYEGALRKAQQIAKNPLVMALLKSQIGDALSGVQTTGGGAN